MPEALAFLTPGVATAIAAMAAVSYLCRVSGYYMMRFIPLTGALKRAFAALPGSIIAAAVLPSLERLGFAATLAIAAALGVMLIRRNEVLALAVGLAVAAGARALGA